MRRLLFALRKLLAEILIVSGIIVFGVAVYELFFSSKIGTHLRLVVAGAALCVAMLGLGLWRWEKSRRMFGWALVALAVEPQVVSVAALLASPSPFTSLDVVFTAPFLGASAVGAAIGCWIVWRARPTLIEPHPQVSAPARSDGEEAGVLAEPHPVLTSPPQTATPETPPAPARKPGRWPRWVAWAAVPVLMVGIGLLLLNQGPSEAERKFVLELELGNQISNTGRVGLAELREALAMKIDRNADIVTQSQQSLDRCQRVVAVAKRHRERNIALIATLEHHMAKEFADDIKVVIENPGGNRNTLQVTESMMAHFKSMNNLVEKPMDESVKLCEKLIHGIGSTLGR